MVDQLCMYLSRGKFVWIFNIKEINKEDSWTWTHQDKLATTN
jgi:hypothetical protein